MKKKNTLTENQLKIVADLVAEFESINASANTEHNDLFAYIDNALDERKQAIIEVDRKNALTQKRHVEFLNSLIADVKPLCDRYAIKISDFSNSITACYVIGFKFHKGRNPDGSFSEYLETKKLEVSIANCYDKASDKTIYSDITQMRLYVANYTYSVVTRESLPKLLADEIIKFRKTYKIF